MPTLSAEDQKLLRQALGVRVHGDGALLIPLVPALKAHSWTDFFGIIGIGGIALAFAQLGEPTRVSAWLLCVQYLAALLAFHCCVFLCLLLRRKLVLPAQSNDVVLHQRRTSFRFTYGFEPAVEAQSHVGMLRVDGGEFRIKRRLFVGKRAVGMAIGRLEGWLVTRSREVKRGDAKELPSQGAGLFLALTDVVRVSPGMVTFRVGMERAGIIVPYAIVGSIGAVLSLFPVHAGLVDSAVMLSILWLANAMSVVVLRLVQREITVEAGVGIRIRKGRTETRYAASSCRFKTRPAVASDQYFAGSPPQIELDLPDPGESQYVVAKSRDHDEKDLSIIAHAMNRYLWGGPVAPIDTATKP
jgi:hypothetical protein